MNASKESMLLYVVTDRTWLGGRCLEDQVEDVLRAGATFLQIREKELTGDAFLEEALKLKRLAVQYHVPFVVNDNVDVALASDADGVHVGQEDQDAAEVRRRIGRDKILGVSAQTVEQALLAQSQGADYIGVGAVFSTSTKSDAADVPYDTLKAICAAVSIPVVAIGGIHAGNILALKGSGVDGVAVISAIFAAKDPAAATRNLLALAKEMVLVIRAFIFDLDGTLLDSMHAWDNIGYEYLRGKGVRDIPDTLWETLKPLSLLEAAQLFIDEYGIRQPPQEICDEINALIEHKYRHEVQLKDGVREFLQTHEDLPMAVATATDRHLVDAALQRLGIARYFRFILTSAEVGNSKQNPDIFLQAAQRLGVAVSEALVFEDALHAIRTAKLAGFPTVGVYEPCFEQEAEEIKRYADQYVHNPNEVIL